MKIYLLFIVSFTLTFCKQDKLERSFIPDEEKTVISEEKEISLKWTESDFKNYKIVHGIKFQFKPIRALDFLARRGDVIVPEDRSDLADESVLIFELQDTNSFKSIFEHPRLVVDRDKMVQYLCGNLMHDIEINQDGKRFSCNGVQYEGVMGANNNKIRVLTFFKGVDLQQDFQIQYNDPLFEAGLIRITKKTKHIAL